MICRKADSLRGFKVYVYIYFSLFTLAPCQVYPLLFSTHRTKNVFFFLVCFQFRSRKPERKEKRKVRNLIPTPHRLRENPKVFSSFFHNEPELGNAQVSTLASNLLIPFTSLFPHKLSPRDIHFLRISKPLNPSSIPPST